MEHLLARGVKRDAPFGPLNWTPLYEAVLKNDTYAMELLLNIGAGLNKRDGVNQTPLHLAILKNRMSAIRLLLSRGAEPSVTDVNNESPLDLALRKNHGE